VLVPPTLPRPAAAQWTPPSVVRIRTLRVELLKIAQPTVALVKSTAEMAQRAGMPAGRTTRQLWPASRVKASVRRAAANHTSRVAAENSCASSVPITGIHRRGAGRAVQLDPPSLLT
jgi:hypothetical protein